MGRNVQNLSAKSSTIHKPDIVSVIEGEGVELKAKGRRLWACCPFHEEKTPSFNIDPEKQIFHCFGCGKGGDVITFIQEKRKLAFKGALEYLKMEVKRTSRRGQLHRGLIRKFRQWENSYHSLLCSRLRDIEKTRSQIKTEADLERALGLLSLESRFLYHLSILESGDDQIKFLLYKDAIHGKF